MSVLVICKFDKDLINNELGSMETSFSLISLIIFSSAQGCVNTELNGPIWPGLERV